MAQSNPLNRPFGNDYSYRRADHGTVLTTEQARQGVTSGRVISVLSVSLALAVVLFAILVAMNP